MTATVHPENDLASPKLASGFFAPEPGTRAPEVATQSLGTHLESTTYVYENAPGCAIAPNRAAAAAAVGMVTTADPALLPTATGGLSRLAADVVELLTRVGGAVLETAELPLIFVTTPTSTGSHDYVEPTFDTPIFTLPNSVDARMRPVPEAVGPHTTFKVGPDGQITNYQDWYPQTNPQDPRPWQAGPRIDLTGSDHAGIPTPHVHETDGTVRPANPDEIPGGS